MDNPILRWAKINNRLIFFLHFLQLLQKIGGQLMWSDHHVVMKYVDLVNTATAASPFLHKFFFQPVWFGPSGAPVPQDFRCSFLLLVIFLNKALQAFYFLNGCWFLCSDSETFLETFMPDADMPLSHFFFVNRQILQTNFECVLVYYLWAAFLKFKKRLVKLTFQTNFMILTFFSIL